MSEQAVSPFPDEARELLIAVMRGQTSSEDCTWPSCSRDDHDRDNANELMEVLAPFVVSRQAVLNLAPDIDRMTRVHRKFNGGWADYPMGEVAARVDAAVRALAGEAGQ